MHLACFFFFLVKYKKVLNSFSIYIYIYIYIYKHCEKYLLISYLIFFYFKRIFVVKLCVLTVYYFLYIVKY
jgi:hypothetical protein